MISQETIDEIRGRMNVVDVVKEFIKLKKQGANEVGKCPFHMEKTGSFTVSSSMQIYKCFGCGKSGDAIQFLMDHERKNFGQAIEWLAVKYGVAIADQGKPKEYVRPPQRLEKLSKKKLDWFEQKRKISNDTLLRLGVTEGAEFMPQHNQECPVICFNYFRNEELVNIKFRGPQKSFKLSKSAELIFYNLDALKGEEIGIIVEGEMDVLTAYECGIYNVVGVPNGTPPKGRNIQLEYLDNCWKEFVDLKKVIIAVDDDQAGRFLKEELGRRIGKEKCMVITYPEGCKDSNEVLLKLGKTAVKEMFDGAKDWPLEGIIPMDDMFDEIVSYYEDGYPAGATAGVEGIDQLLTFYPGHLTMVTGIPGHGKDEFTNLLMTKLSVNSGWKWGIIDAEDPPQIKITKLIEKHAGRAFAKRKDPDHRLSRMQLDKGIAFVDQHFHFVNVSKVEMTMKGILEKARELVERFGINGLLINPWNYLEHKMAPGQSETHYVSEQLTLLVNFLWKHGLHCFLVAHPTKVNKDKKTGKYEIPTLYSISGSANFYNKTHNGLCVYRDIETGTTDIHIQKVKWYWLGHIGWVNFRFNTDVREYIFQSSSVRQAKEDKSIEGLPSGNWREITEKVIDHSQTTIEEPVDDLPF